MSDGINISVKDIEKMDSLCEICIKANHVRFPFNTERKRATRSLEIIHTDFCEPTESMTWDKKNYFVVFLDNYSHFLMVYLIKNKTDVVNVRKTYVAEVEGKWCLKVNKLICDNGKEHANNLLKSMVSRKRNHYEMHNTIFTASQWQS